MYKLLIVDDSSLFRKVLDGILAPHFEIVGRAENGLKAIEILFLRKLGMVYS